MKRLFKATKGTMERYFESRQAVKNFFKETGITLPIHRGPDHWRGETDGTSVQTPSSKKDPSEWKT